MPDRTSLDSSSVYNNLTRPLLNPSRSKKAQSELNCAEALTAQITLSAPGTTHLDAISALLQHEIAGYISPVSGSGKSFVKQSNTPKPNNIVNLLAFYLIALTVSLPVSSAYLII